MEHIVIIGGGASGMACAVMLGRRGARVTLLERSPRLGRKLSATGNGQGNVTNLNMGGEYYFSDDPAKVARLLAKFGAADTITFLESMGGIFLPDARGRVYPAGRQASAVTDLFRRELARFDVTVCTDCRVERIAAEKGQFVLSCGGEERRAERIVLAAGGCAAPHFGTDGSGFSLARMLGHSVTPLSPALVQLRCAKGEVRGLKGIRVDGGLRVLRGQEEVFSCRGDILFTESGVSGDAVFRASSYVRSGDTLLVDLLPEVDEERLFGVLRAHEGLLCLVNNGLGRVLEGRAAGDRRALCALIKRFPLTVAGTLGYDHAQVTKGGVPLAETDDGLMSRLHRGLFLAGELLNVDGACGGYNLQWAFTSAACIAEAIS